MGHPAVELNLRESNPDYAGADALVRPVDLYSCIALRATPDEGVRGYVIQISQPSHAAHPWSCCQSGGPLAYKTDNRNAKIDIDILICFP